jgi:hypothetical protein
MSSGGRAQNSWGTRSNGKGPDLRAALLAHVVTPGFARSESSRGRVRSRCSVAPAPREEHPRQAWEGGRRGNLRWPGIHLWCCLRSKPAYPHIPPMTTVQWL